MKHFNYRLLSVSLIIFLSLSAIINAQAQEMQMKKYCYPANEIKYEPAKVSSENLTQTVKVQNPVLLDENFTMIDSLANCYSYFFLMENKPFVYDRTTDNLITVKRGYYSQYKPEHSGYSGTNRTYNIFLRTSSDNGFSWSDPLLIYDKDAIGYYEGRYPTCYGFKMNNVQYVASNFPVIDYHPDGTGDWQGYVSELWNAGDPENIPMNAHINPSLNGVDYNWSNDSKILAGEKPGSPGEFYWVAASEIYPKDDTDFENASHFAMRRVENDIEDTFLETIPDAWNSNKFSVVDQAGSRYNQLIDLKMADDGVMYLACYGNFYTDDPGATNPNTVAVSRSTDYGLTWDEFEKLPVEVRDNYVSDQGFPGGSIVFGYTTKGFLPFSNGDFSLIVHGALYDSGQQLQGSQIVEIYRQTGIWNMRKVADNTGAYIVYRDYTNTNNERQNPSDIELQMAGTADGTGMVVKWVDLEDYDSQAGTFSTTDVYLSAKSKNGNQWGDKMNVTNSDEIDRATILPDYVKDLNNIPIMKLYSKFLPTESERDSQFVVGLDQYLFIGHFAAPVSVEETDFNNNLTMEILPNPVNEFASLKIYNDGNPINGVIAIYDLLGNKILSNEIGILNSGTSFHNIKTNSMVSGTYLCTISAGDRKITGMLNVLK